jgi:hypothetical protein
MSHEQIPENGLQKTVIVLTQIALLNPPLHILAIGAVARSEIFTHGKELRIGIFEDG